MVPLADGSDMGGSLRNPASFCNVVGLRPSVGRVPNWPSTNAWQLLGVSGPMARNVEDLALLLSVIAGPSVACPAVAGDPGSVFAEPLRPDALERRARSRCRSTSAARSRWTGTWRRWFASAGTVLERRGAIGRAGASRALRVRMRRSRHLRAWMFYDTFGKLCWPSIRMSSSRPWPTTSGTVPPSPAKTSARPIGRMTDAGRAHSPLLRDVRRLGACRSARCRRSVPMTSTQQAINGQPQQTYLDWMRSAYLISATGCPAISVPAGFTPEGWPVGLQLVTAPRTERQPAGARVRVRAGDDRSAIDGPAIGAGAMTARRIRVGIDTGGTFTDVVAVDEETGEIATTKTPSTPADPAVGFMTGVDKVLAQLGLGGDALTAVSHGTTVATNKLLEGKVENLGFITTEGYAHILEIARQSVPDGYGNSYFWVKPPRIVPAHHVKTVRGRLAVDGSEIRPFDVADAERAAAYFRDAGIATIGVCFLHSYANPEHERAMLEVIERVHPDAVVSISSDVLREYREYERSVTTLVDAAVKPNIRRYVANITEPAQRLHHRRQPAQ